MSGVGITYGRGAIFVVVCMQIERQLVTRHLCLIIKVTTGFGLNYWPSSWSFF
jgi:hypothetical protein